jgi:hypothetical protein
LANSYVAVETATHKANSESQSGTLGKLRMRNLTFSLKPLPVPSSTFPCIARKGVMPESIHRKEGSEVMTVAALILLSISSVIFALGAYLWYLTPDPKDLAEEVLCQTKPRSKTPKSTGSNFANKPQPNLTHINCLS